MHRDEILEVLSLFRFLIKSTFDIHVPFGTIRILRVDVIGVTQFLGTATSTGVPFQIPNLRVRIPSLVEASLRGFVPLKTPIVTNPTMTNRLLESRSLARKLVRMVPLQALCVAGMATLAMESVTQAQSPAYTEVPAYRSNDGAQDGRGSGTPVRKPSRDEQYTQIAQEVDLLERQTSLLRRVIRLVSPTVVHIEAIKEESRVDRNAFPSGKLDPKQPRTESRKVEEAGSGVIVQIGNGNYVITNRHVIHTAALQNIRVETYDGVPLTAKRVWEDPSTDIAVVDIDRNNMPIARIGDSRSLEIGDYVFAVGSPFGLNHSVSYGIVSAKGRRNLELGPKSIVFQDFIQTDAAINPGNSGGPLLNLRGEVVGINTAIASNSGGNEGIGFSIPINLAIAVARQLVERGELQRSYLGVSVEKAFNAESRAQGLRTSGAFVKVIKPNSPAEVAGLRYGDVILEFDGTLVENDDHLVQLVGFTPMSRPIDVILQRDGKRIRIQVELTTLPAID